MLPFANLSGDPAQDYLVDALTDGLTTSLARIPENFVIARNTAMTFKGKPIDAKAIGKDLSVRYVLEGSVQPSGDRMRVNAQLIDAGSGAHLWAEQFDTPRADLLQTQDAIVARLANTLNFQLIYAEGARVNRTPAANRDAEDLALQCSAGMWKAGPIGKEADAAFALCEQALAIDPNNVRALTALGNKFWFPAALGLSSDPKGDFERADELESKALALDPNDTWAHSVKGWILLAHGRNEEAVAEFERALTLDASFADADVGLGFDYMRLGEFDKSFEYFDKAIRASPHDPWLAHFYGGKAFANFGLKNYDQSIEWARRAIAINPNIANMHLNLVAALALTEHGAEAREALQRYLALPSSGPKTIAACKAHIEFQHWLPAGVSERMYDGLRKAGMPESMSEARKLAAILVSDIVGYSRLAGSDEDRILARLRTLRSDLIDPTIAVHHGRIVKRTGDGSVIEFRSVVDAVRCAIELQNAMVERNAGVPPERRIELRVGIHVGDVVEESDGDLMGDGVNVAARLKASPSPARSVSPSRPIGR